MNIFTANQVNHVYVAEGESAEVVTISSSTDVDKTKKGSIGVGTTPDGKQVWFTHVGEGGIDRSDLIDKDKIQYINLTYANKMERKLKTIKVSVNAGAIISGSGASAKVIANVDYILRVKLAQVMCPSPTNEYWKFGAAHSVTNSDVKTILRKIAVSLAKSMGNEAIQYLKVYLLAGSTETEVTPTTSEASLTGSYTAILLKEQEGDWILGLKQQKPLNFTVEPSSVKDANGDEVFWADTIDSRGFTKTGGVEPVDGIETTAANIPAAAGTVENGKLCADLEYFWHGERGDRYRMSGYPNYVPTKYMVDPTQKYDVLSIHYSYVGSNHAVQMSEKDLTFIVKPSLTAGFLTKVQTATGVTARVQGATSVTVQGNQ